MSNLSEVLCLIDEAKAEGDVNKLTALYKRFDEVYLPPAYLVHKARAIQLSDGLEYTLDDAERFLQQAIDMDSNLLEAYLELGYLHYSVNDAPDMALVVFDQGRESKRNYCGN